MDTIALRRRDTAAPASVILAATLAAAALGAAAAAFKHMWITAQLGPICGSGAAHCWACYAAPLLALAAFAALGRSKAPILVLAMLTTSCAAAQAEPPAPGDPIVTAEARGHAFARQVCAACHAVERVGASPDPRAPAFRTLAGQYVQLTLQRKLAEIEETGHYAMPPTKVHADEAANLVAYLESLRPR